MSRCVANVVELDPDDCLVILTALSASGGRVDKQLLLALQPRMSDMLNVIKLDERTHDNDEADAALRALYVSAREAADKLGITVSAVTKRYRKGQLVGEKIDGRLFVLLP